MRSPNHDNGHFLEQAVLTNVPETARIMREEPFTPVAPIAGLARVDEVLSRTNDVPYGLAAYVLTHDRVLAEMTFEGLQLGMIGVDDTLLATAPFGGIKDYLEARYIRGKLVSRSGLA